MGLISIDQSKCQKDGVCKGYPYYYPMMLGYPKYTYDRLPEGRTPKITWR